MMFRTQIQLTEEQARELRMLAHQSDLPIAELIRRAIDDLLAKSGHMSSHERKRRLMSIAGKYDSGLTDVARRHDDYLDEIYGQW
jgi:hypothetical protein